MNHKIRNSARRYVLSESSGRQGNPSFQLLLDLRTRHRRCLSHSDMTTLAKYTYSVRLIDDEVQITGYVQPSSRRAITTPLPARAEKRKPALTTVKIAKPLAFSRTLRGMICTSRRGPVHGFAKNKVSAYTVETIVRTVHKRPNCPRTR